MKRYIVLWDNAGMEETDSPNYAKLGNLVHKDYPSYKLPKLVAYDVYENGTVRDCVKYPHGVK